MLTLVGNNEFVVPDGCHGNSNVSIYWTDLDKQIYKGD